MQITTLFIYSIKDTLILDFFELGNFLMVCIVYIQGNLMLRNMNNEYLYFIFIFQQLHGHKIFQINQLQTSLFI